MPSNMTLGFLRIKKVWMNIASDEVMWFPTVICLFVHVLRPIDSQGHRERAKVIQSEPRSSRASQGYPERNEKTVPLQEKPEEALHYI